MTEKSSDSNLRIVFVISGYPPAKCAGMEKNCQLLAQTVAEAGPKVGVLTMKDKGLPASEQETKNLRIYRQLAPIPFGPLWGLTWILQVFWKLYSNRHKWDILLGFKVDLYSIALIWNAASTNRPVLHRIANSEAFGDIALLKKRFGGTYIWNRVKERSHFLAMTKKIKEELINEGVTPNRIHQFVPIIDWDMPEKVTPLSSELRFLFLGRFHEQKNLVMLLEAFRKVVQETPEAQLDLVGKGPEETKLRNYIDNHNLQSNIHLKPWVNNPHEIFHQYQALIISSDSEGLSNAMVQAMSCGLPVISTDVSGARDNLDHGRKTPRIERGSVHRGSAGLIINKGDTKALTTAIRMYMEDTTLRYDIAEEALEHVRHRFTRQMASSLLEKAISAALNESKKS